MHENYIFGLKAKKNALLMDKAIPRSWMLIFVAGRSFIIPLNTQIQNCFLQPFPMMWVDNPKICWNVAYIAKN